MPQQHQQEIDSLHRRAKRRHLPTAYHEHRQGWVVGWASLVNSCLKNRWDMQQQYQQPFTQNYGPNNKKEAHQTSSQLSFHGNWPSLCRNNGKHHKYLEMKVTFV
jgi:hypothetical protein